MASLLGRGVYLKEGAKWRIYSTCSGLLFELGKDLGPGEDTRQFSTVFHLSSMSTVHSFPIYLMSGKHYEVLLLSCNLPCLCLF